MANRTGKYNIILQWYNTLGGIETWNFTAFKSYGYNISGVQIADRDTFADWENNFTDAQYDHDLLDIKAAETITVRSQDLTVQQINAISQIKISPRIFDIDRNVNVKINRSSFQFRTDNDKRHEIAFEITYPDIVVI